jgi:hypothetical protein
MHFERKCRGEGQILHIYYLMLTEVLRISTVLFQVFKLKSALKETLKGFELKGCQKSFTECRGVSCWTGAHENQEEEHRFPTNRRLYKFEEK